MPIRSRRLSLVAVVVLALAACGGDDDSSSGGGDLSSEEQAFVDESLEGFDEEEAGIAEADARCMSESIVTELGLDELDELGITPEKFATDAEFPALDADQAEAVVDRIEGCMDLRAVMLAGFTEGGELSEEDEECLSDAIDDELVHDLMVASIRGDEDEALGDDFFEVIGECVGLTDMN